MNTRSRFVPALACCSVALPVLPLVADDDPISAWLFQESAGSTTAGDSSEVSDGLVRGGVVFGEPGVNGSSTAAYFDGSGDYIEVPHHDDYLIDEGTVVLWFKAESLSTRRELFSKDSSNFDTGGHITIHADNKKRVRVRIQSATGDDWLTSSSNVLSEDEWHHIAFVFGPGGCELYVDGELEDTDSYQGGLGSTSGGIGNHEPLVIGGNTWQSGDLVATPVKNYFKGWIDDVAILPQRLGESDIFVLAGVVDSDRLFSKASSDSGFGVNTGSGANGLLWADLDGDGDLDAIVTGSKARLLWNDSTNGTFSNVSLGNMTRQAAIGDFDNDGDADFWTRNLDLYENLGLGAFKNRNTQGMSTPSNNEAVAAADVNADGRLDLIMLSENGNWIGINYLPGEEEEARVKFEPTNDSSDGLHVSNAYGNGDFMSTVDVNNDGFLDLFYHLGDGRLFLSNGDGTFTWN
ncbi:MAG: LamG domain-containing protein, partial [Planctomycetota bacterium]